jgi:hypothetical protein
MSDPGTRLDEYDKTEWFDVARALKPGLTEDQYEAMWAAFEKTKAEHERKAALQ